LTQGNEVDRFSKILKRLRGDFIASMVDDAPEKKLRFTFVEKLGIWRTVRTRFFEA
jgi:hypothetical protein